MIAYPAIDLRHGRVVQLVGGRPEEERISLPDPVAVARQWVDAGFRALHLVDLDAALGDPPNPRLIGTILETAGIPVQVGGGVRDDDDAARLLDAGATRVIVGTRAVEDRPWLERLAARWPGRIVVAADLKDGWIVTRGWTTGTDLDAERFVADLDPLPLAGVLVTDVGREGRLVGPDTDRFAALARATRHPLQAAGGIKKIDDLRALAAIGAAGAVLGMSLYTGAIEPRAAAREFNQ